MTKHNRRYHRKLRKKTTYVPPGGFDPPDLRIMSPALCR